MIRTKRERKKEIQNIVQLSEAMLEITELNKELDILVNVTRHQERQLDKIRRFVDKET